MTGTRVTYVTAGFPFPLSSGYLRHHHLLRALAPTHTVRLRSLVGRRFDDDAVAGVEGLVEDVQVFREPDGTGTRRTLRRLAPDRRADVAALCAAVRADLDDGTDVVVLSGKETASVIDAVGGRVPVVVDLCDATSARVTQQMRIADPLRRAGLVVWRRTLRDAERRLIEGGDVLLTASERDRHLLLSEGAPARVAEAIVLPNGIDLDEWRRTTPALGSDVVLCGNLGYRPNADAACHLVEDVMPLVRVEVPRARVVIVGVGAPTELAERLTRAGATVTGAVPDVRPHLERAAVVAAPLRVATGIQNKLLEAMAMEVPVVTSTVAAAGLGADAPVTIADEPEAVAAAVVARLQAVASGAPVAPDAAARDWVGARFDWGASGRILARALTTDGRAEVGAC
jgi:glycosyltransferase involved in cell wall biosynthesis